MSCLTASTALGDVLRHSHAPRGSIYHHFPGGRAQLVQEAVRLAAELTTRGLERASKTGEPGTVIQTFVQLWRTTLKDTAYRADCPVVAVAVEASDDNPALAQAAAAFAAWHDALVALLRHSGLPDERAHRIARLTVASGEGAVILARAQRSTDPLDEVERELIDLLKSARP